MNEKGTRDQPDEPFDELFLELQDGLLGGSLELADERVRQALAEHPEWAAGLEDAAHLGLPLRRAAQTRRALVEEGLADRRAEDEAAARAFLTATLPQRSPWWRQPWLLVAAALLVVAGTWIQRRDGAPEEPQPGPSGPLSSSSSPDGEGPFPVGPVGPLGTIESFVIPEQVPAGGTTTILVYDRSTPDAPPVLEATIEERRWTLDDDERAALPAAFTWEYVVRDVMGEAIGRGRYEASSSP